MELFKGIGFCKPRNKAKEKEKEKEPGNNALSESFSLPSPIPQWPQGGGFANGTIQIGELELTKVIKFQKIWSCHSQNANKNGVTFYKPVEIPDNFRVLGHYCHPDNKPLHGFALVAKECTSSTNPLANPINYKSIWNSSLCKEEKNGVYFWAPIPPEGYKAVGFLVTKGPDKPSLDEIACVRSDLTDTAEIHNLILNFEPKSSSDVIKFQVWNTRPSQRGMKGQGIPTCTFFCTDYQQCVDDHDMLPICLKNVNLDLHAMPNLEQIHALIQHYGPMVFFHPKERFLPSSVSWFFENGATLCAKGNPIGESVNSDGSNLPAEGHNDGQYWIDLPIHKHKSIIYGNIDSAELYCHIKPALGGTFTDIAMWVFCPFNGPGTLKLGPVNIPLGKIGQHIGDWEHFTLRINNLDGVLSSVYYSQHSGGVWVDTPDLEFVTGNQAAVYSSKSGHASYPRAGIYLQGSRKLGIGIRNDCARSDLVVNSGAKYKIVSAGYLGGDVMEPHWLRFMREWGPTVVYKSRVAADKMIRHLPGVVRCSLERFLNSLPCELCREEGPTGPKEKNNWSGDERC